MTTPILSVACGDANWSVNQYNLVNAPPERQSFFSDDSLALHVMMVCIAIGAIDIWLFEARLHEWDACWADVRCLTLSPPIPLRLYNLPYWSNLHF